jgi:thioredoxin reductase (NADPH)
VSHYADEPHLSAGLAVTIVGGKNSAVEHALNCFRAGARVTLVYRRAQLRPSVKYWLKPDIENRIKAGEIAARWEAELQEITPEEVVLRSARGPERVPADRVFLLTGYHPDFDFFRGLGIELDAESCRPALDETLESNVPGIHLAGSITSGKNISEIFIENGRYDGEKIFGDAASRARAQQGLESQLRPLGE